MPWTVVVSRIDGEPFGDVEAVRAAIARQLPATRFWRDPSGADKAAFLPDQHRQLFMHLVGHPPADERGLFEGDGFTLELFLGSQPDVKSITVDVRGDGDPLPALRLLCEPLDWCVREVGGELIESQHDLSAGWGEFTRYRDYAAHKLNEEGSMLSELFALNDEWNQALIKKDDATVDRLMAEDYVYVAPNGMILDRQAILEIIRSPGYRIDHGSQTDVVVRGIGPEAAIVRRRWQGVGSFNGRSFTDDHRCVMVCEKQTGECRIVFEQCSYSSKS
jgi:uncharacterized protein DUF4440